MSSLADRIDNDVEAWIPNDGDKLVGKLLEVSTREGDYGEYPYLEVETPEGEFKAVHGYHTVLKNEIASKKPRVGDDIAIKYFGKVVGKKTDSKGKPVEFEKYRLLVEHATGAVETPDWESMKADADEESKVMGAFPDATEEEPF